MFLQQNAEAFIHTRTCNIICYDRISWRIQAQLQDLGWSSGILCAKFAEMKVTFIKVDKNQWKVLDTS